MRLIMYWRMYWGYGLDLVLENVLDYALCLLAGLAGCFCFHFLSLRFILSHFISSPISCHAPLEDEMDQYLNVDQWEKKSEKEFKKKEEDEVEIK